MLALSSKIARCAFGLSFCVGEILAGRLIRTDSSSHPGTCELLQHPARSAEDFRLPWNGDFRNRRLAPPCCRPPNRPKAAPRTTRPYGPLGLSQPRQEIAAIPDQ